MDILIRYKADFSDPIAKKNQFFKEMGISERNLLGGTTPGFKRFENQFKQTTDVVIANFRKIDNSHAAATSNIDRREQLSHSRRVKRDDDYGKLRDFFRAQEVRSEERHLQKLERQQERKQQKDRQAQDREAKRREAKYEREFQKLLNLEERANAKRQSQKQTYGSKIDQVSMDATQRIAHERRIAEEREARRRAEFERYKDLLRREEQTSIEAEQHKAQAKIVAQQKMEEAVRARHVDEMNLEKLTSKQLVQLTRDLARDRRAILRKARTEEDAEIKQQMLRRAREMQDEVSLQRHVLSGRPDVKYGGVGMAAGILGIGRQIMPGGAMMPVIAGVEQLTQAADGNSKAAAMGAIKWGTYTVAILSGLAALRNGFQTYREFNSEMTQSTAIMGKVTEDQQRRLTKAALQTSKEVNIHARETAKSYYFLISAGYDIEQSIQNLPQIARFAKAGMIEMGEATSFAANAQSALGLKFKDPIKNAQELTRVTDVLTQANNIADGSVRQFALALTNKAANALRIYGKSVEEGTAVLAVYHDQGVKSEEAGEALAIVTRDLGRAFQEHESAWRQAKITVYDDDGKMRKFADIIQDIEKRFAGMSDAQKRAQLTALGLQERSVLHTLALVGTSQKIRDYEASLMSAAGATKEVSDKQLKSLDERIKAIGIRFENLAITIIDKAEPALRGMLDFVGGNVEAFTAFVAVVAGGTLALKALSLAMAMTPWGWVILSAGILAGGLLTLTKNTSVLESAIHDANDELSRANAELEKADKVEQTADKVSKLVDEYERLKNSGAAEDQKRLAEIAKEIDQNTGGAAVTVDQYGNVVDVVAGKVRSFVTDLRQQTDEMRRLNYERLQMGIGELNEKIKKGREFTAGVAAEVNDPKTKAPFSAHRAKYGPAPNEDKKYVEERRKVLDQENVLLGQALEARMPLVHKWVQTFEALNKTKATAVDLQLGLGLEAKDAIDALGLLPTKTEENTSPPPTFEGTIGDADKDKKAARERKERFNQAANDLREHYAELNDVTQTEVNNRQKKQSEADRIFLEREIELNDELINLARDPKYQQRATTFIKARSEAQAKLNEVRYKEEAEEQEKFFEQLRRNAAEQYEKGIIPSQKQYNERLRDLDLTENTILLDIAKQHNVDNAALLEDRRRLEHENILATTRERREQLIAESKLLYDKRLGDLELSHAKGLVSEKQYQRDRTNIISEGMLAEAMLLGMSTEAGQKKLLERQQFLNETRVKEEERLARIRKGEGTQDDFLYGFDERFRAQLLKDAQDIQMITDSIASGFTDAFRVIDQGFFQQLEKEFNASNNVFGSWVTGIIKGIWKLATEIVSKAAIFGILALLTGGTGPIFQLLTGGGFEAFMGIGKLQGKKDGGPIQGFPGGGKVLGPGGPKDDAILARLSNGEYVLNADAVRRIGVNVLDRLNSGRTKVVNTGGSDAQNVALVGAHDDTAVLRFKSGGDVTSARRAWIQNALNLARQGKEVSWTNPDGSKHVASKAELEAYRQELAALLAMSPARVDSTGERLSGLQAMDPVSRILRLGAAGEAGELREAFDRSLLTPTTLRAGIADKMQSTAAGVTENVHTAHWMNALGGFVPTSVKTPTGPLPLSPLYYGTVLSNTLVNELDAVSARGNIQRDISGLSRASDILGIDLAGASREGQMALQSINTDRAHSVEGAAVGMGLRGFLDKTTFGQGIVSKIAHGKHALLNKALSFTGMKLGHGAHAPIHSLAHGSTHALLEGGAMTGAGLLMRSGYDKTQASAGMDPLTPFIDQLERKEEMMDQHTERMSKKVQLFSTTAHEEEKASFFEPFAQQTEDMQMGFDEGTNAMIKTMTKFGQAAKTSDGGQMMLGLLGTALSFVPGGNFISAGLGLLGDLFALKDGGPIPRYDNGGPITGPGGPRDDRILMRTPGGRLIRASNGEHMLSARDVRAAGGHAAIMSWRRQLHDHPRFVQSSLRPLSTTSFGADDGLLDLTSISRNGIADLTPIANGLESLGRSIDQQTRRMEDALSRRTTIYDSRELLNNQYREEFRDRRYTLGG